jgi:hypothetical protein
VLSRGWEDATQSNHVVGNGGESGPPMPSASLLDRNVCPRDIWERDLPVVFERRFAKGDEHWNVVELRNRSTSAVNIHLNLDRLDDESRFPELGFPAKPGCLGLTTRRYLLYDFEAGKLMGEYGGYVDLPVPARSSKAIVIRISTNHPQILSIGNRAGQGIDELVNADWEGSINMLAGTTKGTLGSLDTVVRLYIPDDWKIRAIAINERSVNWDGFVPGICRFTVPDKAGPTTWRVTFDGNSAEMPVSRPVDSGLIANVTVARDPADGE